jgi:N utilization substance protein B
MALSQQKFREIVFQLLYSFDFSEAEQEDICALMMYQLAITKKILLQALERKEKVQKRLSEIDRLIAESSVSYDFQRIPRIEKNILRLGAYELLFDDEIPPKVSIAEAIRLSRKFATPEGATFVNAVLDAIYKNSSLVQTKKDKADI